ncbi:hypothetical protein [Clostridium sp. YIM B02555]|jgi:hypothetical protein|nr:hypothetical protein [Clostridium sp. YIM B02555]
MDQLNAYKSESCVKYMLNQCGTKEDLGRKRSLMNTRKYENKTSFFRK